MKSARGGITLKITLLVLGSTFLVFALVLYRSLVNSEDLIAAEAKATALNLVEAMANEIEQEFLIVEKTTRDLSAFLEVSRPDKETLAQLIMRTVMDNPKVYGSSIAFLPYQFKPDLELYAPYYYKSQGEVKFTQLGTKSYDYPSKDWFRVPVEKKKPMWSAPYYDEGGGDTIMTTYSYLLKGMLKDGDFGIKAVVTADISLQYLNDLVNAKQLYEKGYCFVISDRGIFVTARLPKNVLYKTVFDVARRDRHPRAKEFAKAIVDEDSGFLDIGKGFTPYESFLAFTRIDPPGWKLCAILPQDEVYAGVHALHRQIIILAAFGVALLALAAFLTARSISRPLKRMADETLKVGEGNLDIDLSDIRSQDEVGQLAASFTRMTEGLKDRERIKDTFGRYLTQEVVKRLLDSKDGLKLGGESREISILMSDLRGFTALTSSMTPEDIVKFLNRYLGRMVDIILDHRGIIDEIIGDGILAFFGAPEYFENHAELAAACALKMQIAMEEINAINEEDGLPHLEMGVAVHTGEVVVGNIGSEKRAKYGAVGSQVNFTGRMESFTVGGQILTSRATRDKLSDKLVVKDTIHVEMKGVPGKVELFDVQGIQGDHRAQLPERDETMVRIAQEIPVKVFGIHEKIMEGAGTKAVIIEVSLTSAVTLFQGPIAQWEDIRMVPIGTDLGPKRIEIYGKVVSLQNEGDKAQGVIRFTSVPAEAYKMLRKLIK